MSELDGHKSLYSDAFYSRDEFDALYGGAAYRAVKQPVRPGLTASRPLCQGGATTMITFTENAAGPTDASETTAKLTLAEILEIFVGGRLPLRITAYDGSSAGPVDAPFGLELKTPRGTTYLATGRGDLGLARAYIAGDLDIHGVHPGDPYELLKALAESLEFARPPAKVMAQIVRSIGVEHLKPIAPPPQEVPPRWRRVAGGLRHSKSRDAEAIHHHYDVSNTFYEWVLGPSMTYTCACYPAPDASLEDAQDNKYRLIFDKLRLKPGDRLLDVGCGWGGMVRYAARRGVKATGVTLSREQTPWAQKAIADAGLSDLAEVRFGDYRDIAESGFDAVSSIGLLEHIGVRNYASYFRFLQSRLRPGRTAAQPLHHPLRQPDRAVDTGIHRPLRLPRRRAHRVGPHHHRGAGCRSRGAARGEPPPALRADPARLVRQPRRRTGMRRSPRSDSPRRRSGGSTWRVRASPSRPAESSCTTCWR